MLILFLAAVGFCLYTYFLFPLLLGLRCRWENKDHDFGRSQRATPDEWPTLTVIIAAHNEEATLPLKLESLAQVDYPADKLQVLVVSDGSTDNTVNVARAAAVDCIHYDPAQGKPTALNRGLQEATGDYLIYTDARQTLSKNSLKAMIARFSDPTIGAVSGELVIEGGTNHDASDVGLYWKYEKWIRQNESQLFSTTGATGALYAIKRMHALPLKSDVLLDDFEIPISTLKLGLRTVLEPGAIAYDRPEENSSREYQRKVRTLAGNFQSFARNPWLFNPFKNPVWWQFLSHKVFRLLVPLAMLLAFLASFFGQGWFLGLALSAQLLFYSVGVLAFLIPALSNNRVMNFIKVFLQMNAAAVAGAIRYATGRSSVRWKGGA